MEISYGLSLSRLMGNDRLSLDLGLEHGSDIRNNFYSQEVGDGKDSMSINTIETRQQQTQLPRNQTKIEMTKSTNYRRTQSRATTSTQLNIYMPSIPNQVDAGIEGIPITFIEDTSLSNTGIMPGSTTDFEKSGLQQTTSQIMRKLVRNRSAGSERPKPSADIKDNSQVGSCPNLSANRHRASDVSNSSLLSMQRLTVPDFFVTSKTRSRPPRPNVISSSSPNINALGRKQRSRQNSTLSLNEESQSKFYRNACVTQLLDFIYIGNITSAYSQHLLCKLNIDRMVDITNKRPEEVPSRLKSICQCSCGSELPHSRAKLHIGIEDSIDEPIEQYFEEINCFIEATRQCDKKVLIYSYDGNSRAPTIVIQYLMGYYGMTLYQAYTWVKQHHPSVKPNRGFQKVLENLERRWYPDRKPSFSFKNVTENGLRRKAWADC